ncbi:MAG: response regulator transcription factor [Clostridia bacterium]|nr:response regulator transcription factor [Clostridia bacterium]
MQILVCDDEAKAVNELSCMIDDIFSMIKISATIVKTTDPYEVIKAEKAYDMAFLDIEMGQVNGISLATEILKKNPGCFVFFITNHTMYLDDAFDIKAFRYLSKPIDRARLEGSVAKALIKIEERDKKIVLTNKAKRKIEMSTTSIVFIENSNRHTYVVTKDGAFVAEEPFSAVKAMLEDVSDAFVLTHQSFFVNIKYVSYYDSTTVKLTCDGKEYKVHMSRRKYARFDDKMFLEANKQRW